MALKYTLKWENVWYWLCYACVQKQASGRYRDRVRESTICASEIVNNEMKRKHGETAVLAVFMVRSRHLPEEIVESHAKPQSVRLWNTSQKRYRLRHRGRRNKTEVSGDLHGPASLLLSR
jgi:hypothetical protein